MLWYLYDINDNVKCFVQLFLSIPLPKIANAQISCNYSHHTIPLRFNAIMGVTESQFSMNCLSIIFENLDLCFKGKSLRFYLIRTRDIMITALGIP